MAEQNTENAQGQEKATRFRLGEDGPYVSADSKLASYLQGQGESPVKFAESVPANADAKVSEDESAGPVLKTTDLTVTRDSTPSVKPARRGATTEK